MSDKMIMVTGGAGFIGSNTALALAANGWRVAICDSLERGDKWRNVQDIDLFDIVTPPQLPSFLARHEDRLEAIVHMGAISSTTERDVDRLVENNVRLSIELWEWCARAGTPFIYASSGAVYGNGDQGFDDDWSAAGVAALRPINAYGWSKVVCDRRFARDVAEGAHVPPQWAGLRFFNVYGPREEHKGPMRSVISQFTPKVVAGDSVRLFRSHNPQYADGGQLRDFIHVDDCVDVILWLLEHRDVSGIFNVGTGTARSFRDLAVAVFAALEREPSIEYIDTPAEIRSQYQYFTEARMERLRNAGYSHQFLPLERGVETYVHEWVHRYGRMN